MPETTKNICAAIHVDNAANETLKMTLNGSLNGCLRQQGNNQGIEKNCNRALQLAQKGAPTRTRMYRKPKGELEFSGFLQ